MNINFLNAFLKTRDKNKISLGDILMVEKGKDGLGTFTRCAGSKFLFPGFTSQETLKVVGAIKGMIPLGIDFMHKGLGEYIKKDPKEYCRFVREIYRWFNETLIKRENDEGMKDKWRKMRDIVCVILENDDAYRFRMQDALPELNLKECELTEADKYWFRCKPYNFKGRDEIIKKYGNGEY